MEMILLKYTHTHVRACVPVHTHAVEECDWDVGQMSGRKRDARGSGCVCVGGES